jgi:hypothetical protein
MKNRSRKEGEKEGRKEAGSKQGRKQPSSDLAIKSRTKPTRE